MNGERPAPTVYTRAQLAEWLSAPELALWPNTMTIDGLMRQAGAALAEPLFSEADERALNLGQNILDASGLGGLILIREAVSSLMAAVRNR